MSRGEGAAQAGQGANKGKKDLARAQTQHGENIAAQKEQTAALNNVLQAQSQAKPNNGGGNGGGTAG